MSKRQLVLEVEPATGHGSLLVSIRRSTRAEIETWGGCIGAVSLRSASNRHGYTAGVLRLRGVSDVRRQLACGSPLSTVRNGASWRVSRRDEATPLWWWVVLWVRRMPAHFLARRVDAPTRFHGIAMIASCTAAALCVTHHSSTMSNVA
jgi:hypothetical protein